MGNGDDLFVYEAGSSVVGAVKAEGGTDTFRLGTFDGGFDVALLGEAATYRGFERLTLATGSSWVAWGRSTFSGDTLVQGASLLLIGAALPAATVTVGGDAESGLKGALLGAGTIGALKVADGGLVAPGGIGPTGTLNVSGTVAFADGSTYGVRASNAGTVDRIAAAGTATIDPGAGVLLDAAPAGLAWGTRYTILSAAGGVTGMFGSLAGAPDYLFVTPTLGADATDIFLTLERNRVPLARYAATPNGRAAAFALDRYGRWAVPGGSALYDTVLQQTGPAVVRAAFTQLAGDIHATVGGTIFTENALVNDAILGRLRQAGHAGEAGAAMALGSGGPVTADVQPAPAQAEPAGPVLTAWAQGYGQWIDANAGALEASTRLGGALVGLDVTAGSLVYGFAVGYASSSTTSGTASADADTVRLAGYGAVHGGAWTVRAGADIGWASLSTARAVALTGEQPKADYDATSTSLFGELAYAAGLGGLALEPFAGFAWSYMDLGGFTERAAPVAGLRSDGDSLSIPYSTLGLRAATRFAAWDGVDLTAHASAGWRHAFADVMPTRSLIFQSTGTAFTVEGGAGGGR